jgi:hypothetical protein
MGRFAHVDRDPGSDLIHEPTILMSVGDDDAERRIAGLCGSDDRMRNRRWIVAVEWHPEIEDERLA